MSKWSDDAFLDRLRTYGDKDADACAEQLIGMGNLSKLFAEATTNYGGISPGLPAPLDKFLHDTWVMPDDVDLRQIARGEDVFGSHAFQSALVLLAKSLPEGYAAPCLARILSLSGDLQHHPYRRLLGVLQMVVNVTTVHGFHPRGQALITAKKLRLLHAGIRHIVRNTPGFEDYEETYGVPVNLEDMLGTIMGLSYLVIDGLKKLKMPLEPWEAEDLYYLWTVFARAMGIHPPGEPASTEFVPMTLDEAREFYEAYARRHYVDAAQNPHGVQLARENLNMLKDMMPWPLRLLGLGVIPHMYMQDLIGKEGCARVGIKPVRGRWILNWVMIHLGAILVKPFERGEDPESPHDHWSRAFFQRMINKEYGGEVEFLFPQDLEDLRKLA